MDLYFKKSSRKTRSRLLGQKNHYRTHFYNMCNTLRATERQVKENRKEVFISNTTFSQTIEEVCIQAVRTMDSRFLELWYCSTGN